MFRNTTTILPLILLLVAAPAIAACPAAPDVGCLAAELSQLAVKNSGDDSNTLSWKWKKGDSFSHDDLGDPLASTEYLLCVYDSTSGIFSLSTSLLVPPGIAWTNKDPKGWQYKDSSGTHDGVQKIKLKPGDSSRSSVQLKARGASLPLPAPASETRFFDQDPGVIVELHKQSGSGPSTCWTSGEFGDSDTSSNDPAGFKATNQ